MSSLTANDPPPAAANDAAPDHGIMLRGQLQF